MNKSLTYLLNNDKNNFNLVNIHGIKNFIKKAVPYNTEIEEDFDDRAVLLSIRIPWWTWKIPYFARENKVIINRIKRRINRYGAAGVEYRIEYR